MMPRVLAVMAIADLINCRVTALKISTATTVTSLSGVYNRQVVQATVKYASDSNSMR